MPEEIPLWLLEANDASNQTHLFLDMVATQERLFELEGFLQQAGIIQEYKEGGEIMAGHALDLELTGGISPMDMGWVLGCATLVFLMQLGFASLEAGMCRPENVITTYVKNMTDFMLGTVSALIFGFAIAYGQVPFLEHIPAWKFFFHLVFQATASTILSGSMAERINVIGYMALSLFLASFVYPTSVRLTWGGGYLSHLDPPFHDFAGSGVVHIVGGSAALAGVLVLGSRYKRWEKPHMFMCHSIPQVLSGMLLLWVGWFGFNPGSTGSMSTPQAALWASNAAMTTSISPAAAGSFTIFYDLCLTEFEHLDIVRIANCVLSGLVAITSGCNVLSPWASLVVGFVSCFVYFHGSALIKKYEIDDVVDAIPVHAFNGAWGCIATGLFHPDQGLLTTGSPALLGSQLISVVVLFLLGFTPVYCFCLWLNKKDVLRAPLEAEKMGLDLYIFAAQAYANIYEPDDAYDDGFTYDAPYDDSTGLRSSNVEDAGWETDSFGPPRLRRSLDGNAQILVQDLPEEFQALMEVVDQVSDTSKVKETTSVVETQTNGSSGGDSPSSPQYMQHQHQQELTSPQITHHHQQERSSPQITQHLQDQQQQDQQQQHQPESALRQQQHQHQRDPTALNSSRPLPGPPPGPYDDDALLTS